MAHKKRERMSSVDTAWLRMDRPSNLMMICGVLIFHERIALGRLKATIADRFLRFHALPAARRADRRRARTGKPMRLSTSTRTCSEPRFSARAARWSSRRW